MKTQEILTIIAISALGLCLLCGLAKMAMKNPKKRSDCDKACGALFFVAVALMAVGQLLGETHTSGFEMDAGRKPSENCVMKAKSAAKRTHDRVLKNCEASKRPRPRPNPPHHHHHHNEITCEDESGMCGEGAMRGKGFEITDVDLCYKNDTNRSRADAVRACMELDGSGDGCYTNSFSSLRQCERQG